MSANQRFTIEVVNENGEPIAPRENARLFVSQCGVIVRDNVPISIQEWNKPKVGTSYVDSRSKDFLWDTLKSHFTLPPECDELKVKDWALKKMATQF